MPKLPGLNFTSTQLFFLVTAQEFCSKSQYEGIDTDSNDFHDMYEISRCKILIIFDKLKKFQNSLAFGTRWNRKSKF